MRRNVHKIALTAVVMMALLMPLQAFATVIAAIMSSDQPRYREAHRAFVKALATRGYSAPGTEIILQAPNPDSMSWSNTVRKFNAYRPDLIVTYGAPAALVAFRESAGIPVVSVDVFSSEQPTKGLCGVSSRVPMVTLIKALQGIKPYLRIGVLYTPREAGSLNQLEDVKKYSLQLGYTVVEASVKSPESLDAAVNKLLGKADAIVATESAAVSRQFEKIVAKAKARNMPVVSTMPDAAELGALVSLEINPDEQGHLAAEMAARVLEGASTEQLPLVSPHRIDLVINMRAAHEMGIQIPFSVIGSATKLIK